MRHRVMGRKLNRSTAHRRAMWRNMAIALFTHEQITTTIPKAKSVQPFVEKLISTARRGDLAARRRVIAEIGDPLLVRHEDDENVDRNRYGEIKRAPRVVKRLFEDIAPRYADRPGGYTRIIRLAKHRIGDGTDLCVLQLVGDEQGPQVAGRFSRRREMANHRMERAAALRRQPGDTTAAAAAASEPAASTPAPDTDTATAAPEPAPTPPETDASTDGGEESPKA